MKDWGRLSRFYKDISEGSEKQSRRSPAGSERKTWKPRHLGRATPQPPAPWWQHPVTMVTTEAGQLQDDSGKQGSVLRVTGECGKHTGQAQWLHHPNQSNMAVRIVTAVGHCSWGDFTPGTGTEVRISMQCGGVQTGRGPHGSTPWCFCTKVPNNEGAGERAVNHLHQGEHGRPRTMGRCPEEVHTAW